MNKIKNKAALQQSPARNSYSELRKVPKLSIHDDYVRPIRDQFWKQYDKPHPTTSLTIQYGHFFAINPTKSYASLPSLPRSWTVWRLFWTSWQGDDHVIRMKIITSRVNKYTAAKRSPRWSTVSQDSRSSCHYRDTHKKRQLQYQCHPSENRNPENYLFLPSSLLKNTLQVYDPRLNDGKEEMRLDLVG